MIDLNSIPVAIKTGADSYLIAYQLPEPMLDQWSSRAPDAQFKLEVSRLGGDAWMPLGVQKIGQSFKVPKSFGPIPLFRTETEDGHRYIGLRKIDLQGTSNFRDIGGYLTEKGLQLRFGRIFRSDNLSKLTSSDWEVIKGLGISKIIDLRRSDEKARSQTVVPLDSGIEIIEIPIDVEILGKSELIEHIFSKAIKRVTNDDMAQMYEDLLAKSRSELAQTVSLLLEPTQTSTIVHCTAGKDRTGLSVALVQLLLSVPQQQVMSDFLLSNAFRTPTRIAALSEKLKSHQVNIDDIVPYLSASKQALLRAFKILDSQYEGAIDYLNFDETYAPTSTDEWKTHILYT